MSPTGLEVPVFGASAALRVVEAGASRIELNAAGSYPAGGLTPSLDDLERVIVAGLNVPLRVMIRPRGPPPPYMSAAATAAAVRSAPPPLSQENALQGRDFIYSDEEIEQMHDDIVKFKASGLLNVARGDGFVFGVLTERLSATISPTSYVGDEDRHSREPSLACVVDVARCTRLVEAARPFKTVFHRAFDEVVSHNGGVRDGAGRRPWEKALDDLEQCGFNGILTSGGLGSAAQNAETLALILDAAAEKDIEIIVGGGVRSKNIPELLKQLRLGERKQPVFMHSSCLTASETENVDLLEVEAIVKQLR